MADGQRVILCIDDDPDILDTLVTAMERDGRFEVRTATRGFDAGVEANRFRPDILILDYMLPDINGTLVCRTIRQSEEFQDMRILIISGVIKRREIDEIFQAGADEFIKKPFEIESVISKVAEMVKV